MILPQKKRRKYGVRATPKHDRVAVPVLRAFQHSLVLFEHDGQRVGAHVSPLPSPGDLATFPRRPLAKPPTYQRYRVLSVTPGSLRDRRAAVAQVQPIDDPKQPSES